MPGGWGSYLKYETINRFEYKRIKPKNDTNQMLIKYWFNEYNINQLIEYKVSF